MEGGYGLDFLLTSEEYTQIARDHTLITVTCSLRVGLPISSFRDSVCAEGEREKASSTELGPNGFSHGDLLLTMREGRHGKCMVLDRGRRGYLSLRVQVATLLIYGPWVHRSAPKRWVAR